MSDTSVVVDRTLVGIADSELRSFTTTIGCICRQSDLYLPWNMLAGVSGPRKRKKRARYGDDDWDTENEPPAIIIKPEKDSIVGKAEAELNNQKTLVFGKTPLGLSNTADLSRDASLPGTSSPPIAECKVPFCSIRTLCAQEVGVPK